MQVRDQPERGVAYRYYVENAFAAIGTEVDLIVRGKPLPAKIAPMPFVPNRYRR